MSNHITLAIAALLLAATTACAKPPDPLVLKKAETHRALASNKLNEGEFEMAIRQYQQSLELIPNDAETHFGLGEAYRRKSEFRLAETHFRRALKIDPTHSEAHLNLAVIYLHEGRWAEAIAENSKLIEDPTFLRPARALVNRGWAHYKSGDLVGAEKDLRDALAFEGRNLQALLNLGIVTYAQGEVVESVGLFESVIDLLENRPPQIGGRAEAQARFHLARAQVKLGQLEAAVKNLRVAADLGGQGEWGQKSREYLTVLR
jgi:type IV pilus assembly protein PilF